MQPVGFTAQDLLGFYDYKKLNVYDASTNPDGMTNDEAAGQDRWFRRCFLGKVTPIAEDPVSIAYGYLTNPRHYAPRWYHEGMAVFMETWMGGGLGRALGGYDEMVFRAKVRDGAHIYDPVGLESEGTTIDFQAGANSYLYGTRFVTHMASQQGIGQRLGVLEGDRTVTQRRVDLG